MSKLQPNYAFKYLIGGVSVRNEPIISTLWTSSKPMEIDEEIEIYLNKNTEFGINVEKTNLYQIFNFVPKNMPAYPANKEFINKIEKEIPVFVDPCLANNWHYNIDDFLAFAVSHGVNKVYLMIITTEENKLEWRSCEMQFKWDKP